GCHGSYHLDGARAFRVGGRRMPRSAISTPWPPGRRTPGRPKGPGGSFLTFALDEICARALLAWMLLCSYAASPTRLRQGEAASAVRRAKCTTTSRHFAPLRVPKSFWQPVCFRGGRPPGRGVARPDFGIGRPARCPSSEQERFHVSERGHRWGSEEG